MHKSFLNSISVMFRDLKLFILTRIQIVLIKIFFDSVYKISQSQTPDTQPSLVVRR